MAKKYYWLKLKEDFFRDKKIKKLRKIAGGDTYTIIYLKMQLLSLKNDGVLIYEEVEDTFAEEIALEIDEDIENVKITLMFLAKNGLLVETMQDHYVMTETIQNIGSETSVAERVRKHRKLKAEREKTLETEEQKMLPSNDEVLHCNTNETKCNIEIDIEKREKRKEIEQDIDKDKKVKVPYEKIADLFHETCPSFSKIIKITDDRKKTMNARFKEYKGDLNIFRELFTKAEQSDFLKGNNKSNWKANFDWLLNQKNMIKVLEGNYDNNASKKNVREEIVPDWLNKDIKAEPMSEEETKEMEDLFSEFKEDDFEERKKALQERLKSKYGPNASKGENEA